MGPCLTFSVASLLVSISFFSLAKRLHLRFLLYYCYLFSLLISLLVTAFDMLPVSTESLLQILSDYTTLSRWQCSSF